MRRKNKMDVNIIKVNPREERITIDGITLLSIEEYEKYRENEEEV